MESQHGVNGTMYEDIFFTEEVIPTAKIVRHLHVEISRQNSNLTEIKRQLVSEAKSLGACAIMNFKYGQKKHKTWELVFSFKWDTESWHGDGDAVII